MHSHALQDREHTHLEHSAWTILKHQTPIWPVDRRICPLQASSIGSSAAWRQTPCKTTTVKRHLSPNDLGGEKIRKKVSFPSCKLGTDGSPRPCGTCPVTPLGTTALPAPPETCAWDQAAGSLLQKSQLENLSPERMTKRTGTHASLHGEHARAPPHAA